MMWIDIQCLCLHVRKHHSGTLVKQWNVRRSAGKHRHNDLVPIPDSSQLVGQMKRIGARANGERRLPARELLAELLFKTLDLGTLSDPAAPQRLSHRFHRPGRDVRMAED